MASKNEKQPCNAQLTVTVAYFDPSNRTEQLAVIRIDARSLDGKWSAQADIPMEKLTPATLKTAFPLLRLTGARWSGLIDALIDQLYSGLADGTVHAGYLFTEMGWAHLPDGGLVRVCGNKVIGKVDRPYTLSPEINRYHLLDTSLPVAAMVSVLLTVQFPALMVIAFVLLASVRSLLIEAGIEFQGVMLLEGKQGLGKTTVATRAGAVYENADTKHVAGVVQLGSTFASVRDALSTFRDAAVLVDDLCLSASVSTQRSSLDTAAKIMRMATGTIPLTKKHGDETEENYAQALAIVTAEYTFGNMSDLTRCITVPVKEQLRLPDALTPELTGAAVRHFSAWVAEHHEAFVGRMKTATRGDVVPKKFDQRIRTNYSILLAIMEEFLLSLQPLEVDNEFSKLLSDHFRKALDTALAEHANLIDDLRADVPRGNIAYVILGAIANKALRPGKRILKDNDERLARYQKRGCLRLKGKDIGVDPEVLLQLVRTQPGYHNATRNGVARELKDIGALVLQRNGQHTTNLVKLWNDGPWGYRIHLDVLEDEVEEF